MGVRHRFLFKLTVALAALAVVLFLTHTLWLGWLGSALVYDQGPAKADIAVVLAGDSWGHRILKGAELVRDGYVPAVLVSGPPGFYGFRESDMAIQFVIHKGYPAQWFVALPIEAQSTKDEAVEVLAELRRRNVHSFLLVTSNFHTARAARIYRRSERETGDGPSFRTVAAPDEFFQPDRWWRTRQGCKILVNEWAKTVANVLGI